MTYTTCLQLIKTAANTSALPPDVAQAIANSVATRQPPGGDWAPAGGDWGPRIRSPYQPRRKSSPSAGYQPKRPRQPGVTPASPKPAANTSELPPDVAQAIANSVATPQPAGGDWATNQNTRQRTKKSKPSATPKTNTTNSTVTKSSQAPVKPSQKEDLLLPPPPNTYQGFGKAMGYIAGVPISYWIAKKLAGGDKQWNKMSLLKRLLYLGGVGVPTVLASGYLGGELGHNFRT